jgi:hypothetical protein
MVDSIVLVVVVVCLMIDNCKLYQLRTRGRLRRLLEDEEEPEEAKGEVAEENTDRTTWIRNFWSFSVKILSLYNR